MGTTALRQLLKSLCSHTHWKYAVLWKLKHGSPMILTWEDGYIDYPKPTEVAQAVESKCKDTYSNGANDILSSLFETNTWNGSPGGYSIGLAVADMSHLQYTLGEGVVGKVACSGNHCWISFNEIFTGDFNPKLVPECPEEWLHQFALGIKTILLVPVLPHGVLQLGSLEEVAEDFEIVGNVKGRFNNLNGAGGNSVPSILPRDFQAQVSLSLKFNPTAYLNAPSAAEISPVKYEDSNHSMMINSFKVDEDDLSSLSQVLPLAAQDAFRSRGKDFPGPFEHESENNINGSLIGLAEASTPSESINASQLETMESKLFELSYLIEELQAYSECNDYDMGVFGELFGRIKNSYPTGDTAGELSGGEAATDMDHKNVSRFLSFPRDCELHKALGPSFWRQTNEKCDRSFFIEGAYSSSRLTCNKDLSDGTEPPCFDREGDAESLLEAVVANAYGSLDHTPDDKSNSSQYFTTQTQNQSETRSLVTSACNGENGNANTTSAAVKSMMNTIFNKECQERGYSNKQPYKGRKISNVRRRTRPGDNQRPRPRPRDRQLIQDRLKELRELVPNGAKCSIDGLLDRTIKHMLHLRGVTDQAEKLSQWVDEEDGRRKSWRSAETKGNCQNGTSWAFEFGSELNVCPIVVDDLAYPGHMLIEMVCNEHALFLEIAQVIRGLELTILKGAMESGLNNTWAYFIVEASKGFHRLDIFWSLMRLLQRKRNSFSSKI